MPIDTGSPVTADFERPNEVPAAVVELDDAVDDADPVTSTTENAPGADPTTIGGRREITFMGNAYDLTSVLAIATGAITLVSCLSCGWTFYCLPVLPIVLGIIGLLAAKQSIDAERTRLLSWLGIGGGGVGLIIMLAGILAYVAFLILMVIWSTQGTQYPHG